MGAGFVILFWLFAVGMYLIAILFLIGLCFFSWNKKWTLAKWLTGSLAALMIVAAILTAGLVVWGIARASNPNCVFESTFMVSPPSSVSEIKSSCYWFADTGSIFLRFKASAEDFKKLTPAHLEIKTVDEMKRDTPTEFGDGTPSWWDFKIDQNWIYYERIHRLDESKTNVISGIKGFYSETEYYAYNPKTGLVYYRFLGID